MPRINPDEPQLLFWHGSQRWEGPPDIRPPRKDCYECGPGIYLTTNYETARRYAKGGGKTLRIAIDPATRWLEEVDVEWAVVEDFVKGSKLRKKSQILDDLRRALARQRDTTRLPLQYLVNLSVNHEAASGQAGVELAAFLHEQGVDASRHTHKSQEDWVVVFNPQIIKGWDAIPASDISLDDYHLPLVPQQLASLAPRRRPTP